MNDKAQERLARACYHTVLRRIRDYEKAEWTEFSKCEDCPAVFLTNHPLGGVMSSEGRAFDVAEEIANRWNGGAK